MSIEVKQMVVNSTIDEPKQNKLTPQCNEDLLLRKTLLQDCEKLIKQMLNESRER